MYMRNVREEYKVEDDHTLLTHTDDGAYSIGNYLFLYFVFLLYSYSDSVVILERWGDFYTVQFDSANISAMTLSLHKLERSSIVVGPDSLALDICRNCVHNKISSYHPYSSYPLPGVYVKSYGYGKGLIWVHYNKGQLVGVKLTGLYYYIDSEI